MARHSTFFLFLILPFWLSAQEPAHVFPLPESIIRSHARIFPFSDGSWLLVERKWKSNVSGQYNCVYSKLDATWHTVWSWEVPIPDSDGFFQWEQFTFKDGRVLLSGFMKACGGFNTRPVAYLLSATGELVWETQFEGNDLSDINLRSGLSMTAQAEEQAFWISTGNIIGYIHKFDLNTGQLLERFSTGQHFWEIRAIPGAADTLVWFTFPGDLRICKGATLIQNISNSGSLDYLFYDVKTYPVEPRIVAVTEQRGLLFIRMNGQSQALTEVYAEDFDLKNGNQLLVLSNLPGQVDYTRKSIVQYSGPQFSQKTIHGPDWLVNGYELTQVYWQGDQALVTGQHITGARDTIHFAPPYFSNIQFSGHGFVYTADLSVHPLPTPVVSDAGISAFSAGKRSWWYNPDTLGMMYFKLKDIEVEIQNTGTDVLQSVYLCAQYDRPLYLQCTGQPAFVRKYDQLNLLPGERKLIQIHELPFAATDADYNEDLKEICFWVTLPNDRLDLNFQNDAYCISQLAAEIPKPHGLSIFPNPAHDQLWFTATEQGFNVADFQVCNVLGQIIFDSRINSEGDYFVLNLTTFAPGLYFLRCKEGLFPFVKR